MLLHGNFVVLSVVLFFRKMFSFFFQHFFLQMQFSTWSRCFDVIFQTFLIVLMVAAVMAYPAEDTSGARDKRSGLLVAGVAPLVPPISTTVYNHHPVVWPYVYPGHVLLHG